MNILFGNIEVYVLLKGLVVVISSCIFICAALYQVVFLSISARVFFSASPCMPFSYFLHVFSCQKCFVLVEMCLWTAWAN